MIEESKLANGIEALGFQVDFVEFWLFLVYTQPTSLFLKPVSVWRFSADVDEDSYRVPVYTGVFGALEISATKKSFCLLESLG